MTPGQEYLTAGGIVLTGAVAAYTVHVVDMVRQWWRDSDERLTRLATLPEAVPVVTCGECLVVLDDTTRAPSCLSHDTCLDCSPTPACTECSIEFDEALTGRWVGGLFLDIETFRMDFEDESDWGYTR